MSGILSLFGRAEKPFGEVETAYRMFSITPRTKTYQMRSRPFKQLTDRMNQQVNEQRIDEALKSGHLKLRLHYSLHGKLDLTALADMAELAIDQNQLHEAVVYAEEGLQ